MRRILMAQKQGEDIGTHYIVQSNITLGNGIYAIIPSKTDEFYFTLNISVTGADYEFLLNCLKKGSTLSGVRYYRGTFQQRPISVGYSYVLDAGQELLFICTDESNRSESYIVPEDMAGAQVNAYLNTLLTAEEKSDHLVVFRNRSHGGVSGELVWASLMSMCQLSASDPTSQMCAYGYGSPYNVGPQDDAAICLKAGSVIEKTISFKHQYV